MSTNIVTRESKRAKDKFSMLNWLNRLVNGSNGEKDEELEFLYSVARARQEWLDAQSFFENAVEPDLIDHAIYKMEAARSKYMYLLKQAKERNFKINV